jgi:hypothetical protein
VAFRADQKAIGTAIRGGALKSHLQGLKAPPPLRYIVGTLVVDLLRPGRLLNLYQSSDAWRLATEQGSAIQLTSLDYHNDLIWSRDALEPEWYLLAGPITLLWRCGPRL